MDKSYNNKKAKDIQEDISLGSLLRRSREERHIDLDEVVRVTRIRRHTLEALENEEWSKLPSQVFVKGFLKSYAEFLGLDKEMVLNYYQKASPFQKYKPQVLKEIRPKSDRWNLIIIISVLALALIAAIIYLKRSNISIVEKVFQYLDTQNHVEKKGYPVGREDNKGRDDKRGKGVFLKDEKMVEEEKETVSKSKSIQDNIILEEPIIPKKTRDEKPLSPRYILTANVNSGTWIAIYIDDKPVKEYLFRPGRTPRWMADEGFDILVGNAGGIKFLLNGKEVGYLGPEGKVVRVKLPQGYERNVTSRLETEN